MCTTSISRDGQKLSRHGSSWYGLVSLVAFGQRLDLMILEIILMIFSNLNNPMILRSAAAWESLTVPEDLSNTGALHYPMLASRRMQRTAFDPGVGLQAGLWVFVFKRNFLLRTIRKIPGSLLSLTVAAPKTTKPKVIGAASPSKWEMLIFQVFV